MEVRYKVSEYRELAKEVCLLTNELKQLSDIICSRELYEDYTTQSNATCSAIDIIDKLKNFLVQMNFLTCNVAQDLQEKENEINDNIFSDDVDFVSGDTVELCNSEEGNSELLETSESEDVQEGN